MERCPGVGHPEGISVFMEQTRVADRIEQALRAARHTRAFRLGKGVLSEVPTVFSSLFPGARAALVADQNTWRAAGRDVYGAFREQGVDVSTPHVFETPPHADLAAVEEARAYLAETGGIAVAVGAGSINDICKVASDRRGNGYLCVATAASVDGYASSGAPMTVDGFKKTVPCAAPTGVVADSEVLLHAPYALTASGYADLVAKVPAGADWLIADALEAGNEPIHAEAWAMVQTPLEGWINRPQALQAGDPAAFAGLFEGLAVSGFAMQAADSSRPASGCEHLFSHVWEMSGLTMRDGVEPSHGFKVALGSLSATAAMVRLFADPFTESDVAEARRRYPSWEERKAMIHRLFGDGGLAERIVQESRAKHLEGRALDARLERIAGKWEALRRLVDGQIMEFARMQAMFRVAGCPTEPQAIGLSVERCAATVIAAQMIRSRYTVLDLAYETGRLHVVVDAVLSAFATERQPGGGV